jgi:hypothetical protein
VTFLRRRTHQVNNNRKLFFYRYKETSSIALLHKLSELSHLLRPMKLALAQKQSDYTVSVLGRDEEYTVKYNPLPEGVPEGKARGNS